LATDEVFAQVTEALREGTAGKANPKTWGILKSFKKDKKHTLWAALWGSV
jgi:hypothetical protein